MYEPKREIQIEGRTLPLVLNVVALKEVQKRYGGLAQMGTIFEGNQEAAISEIPWLIALLANQGIALKNEEEGDAQKPVTEDWVALHMRPKQIGKWQGVILDAINDGMKDDEAPEKEEEDEVLNEVLASKNAPGAEE